MKTKSLILGYFIAAILSSTALALTINEQVTPAYVREHPKEWSVKAVKKESGLIQFTVVRTLSEPKYLVARLAVNHGAGSLRQATPHCLGRGKATLSTSPSPRRI